MVLQHIEQPKDRKGEGSCLRPRVRGWSKDACSKESRQKEWTQHSSWRGGERYRPREEASTNSYPRPSQVSIYPPVYPTISTIHSPANLSKHPPMHASTQACIHPGMRPPMYASTHACIHPGMHPPMYAFTQA